MGGKRVGTTQSSARRRGGRGRRRTVIADKYEGKPLNSPKGVIVKSDDTIWFTDPTYGIESGHEGWQAEPELPRNVYRFDPRWVVVQQKLPWAESCSPKWPTIYVSAGHAHTRLFTAASTSIYAIDTNAQGVEL